MSDAVKRDRWQRPMILPDPDNTHQWGWREADAKAGVPPAKWRAKSYLRPSTLAKTLDKGEGLSLWKQRVVALGLARDERLFGSLRVVAAGPDPLGAGRKTLDGVVASAFEVGGGTRAAEDGTSIHTVSEWIDAGVDYDESLLPGPVAVAADAYRRVTRAAGIRRIESELFVVNDELTCGGR